ncbi:MAG: hypothetical protein DHS80DRAFT_24749 [Piptocephalis tieghemiana]|nr:MAG: hypothetical protein DHS80DRAFT_24749 [Piptocephalis tieghemiana]
MRPLLSKRSQSETASQGKKSSSKRFGREKKPPPTSSPPVLPSKVQSPLPYSPSSSSSSSSSSSPSPIAFANSPYSPAITASPTIPPSPAFPSSPSMVPRRTSSISMASYRPPLTPTAPLPSIPSSIHSSSPSERSLAPSSSAKASSSSNSRTSINSKHSSFLFDPEQERRIAQRRSRAKSLVYARTAQHISSYLRLHVHVDAAPSSSSSSSSSSSNSILSFPLTVRRDQRVEELAHLIEVEYAFTYGMSHSPPPPSSPPRALPSKRSLTDPKLPIPPPVALSASEDSLNLLQGLPTTTTTTTISSSPSFSSPSSSSSSSSSSPPIPSKSLTSPYPYPSPVPLPANLQTSSSSSSSTMDRLVMFPTPPPIHSASASTSHLPYSDSPINRPSPDDLEPRPSSSSGHASLPSTSSPLSRPIEQGKAIKTFVQRAKPTITTSPSPSSSSSSIASIDQDVFVGRGVSRILASNSSTSNSSTSNSPPLPPLLAPSISLPLVENNLKNDPPPPTLPDSFSSQTKSPPSPKYKPLVCGQILLGDSPLMYDERVGDVLEMGDVIRVVNVFEHPDDPKEEEVLTHSEDQDSPPSSTDHAWYTIRKLEAHTASIIPNPVSLTNGPGPASKRTTNATLVNGPSDVLSPPTSPEEEESEGDKGEKVMEKDQEDTSIPVGKILGNMSGDARLQLLLRDRTGLDLLMRHVTAQLALESLLFYMEVEAFRQCEEDRRVLSIYARFLYDVYIRVDAPLQVNLSAEVREEVEKCPRVWSGMFDESQEVVYGLLKHHILQGFESSREGKEWMKIREGLLSSRNTSTGKQVIASSPSPFPPSSGHFPDQKSNSILFLSSPPYPPPLSLPHPSIGFIPYHGLGAVWDVSIEETRERAKQGKLFLPPKPPSISSPFEEKAHPLMSQGSSSQGRVSTDTTNSVGGYVPEFSLSRHEDELGLRQWRDQVLDGILERFQFSSQNSMDLSLPQSGSSAPTTATSSSSSTTSSPAISGLSHSLHESTGQDGPFELASCDAASFTRPSVESLRRRAPAVKLTPAQKQRRVKTHGKLTKFFGAQPTSTLPGDTESGPEGDSWDGLGTEEEGEGEEEEDDNDELECMEGRSEMDKGNPERSLDPSKVLEGPKGEKVVLGEEEEEEEDDDDDDEDGSGMAQKKRNRKRAHKLIGFFGDQLPDEAMVQQRLKRPESPIDQPATLSPPSGGTKGSSRKGSSSSLQPDEEGGEEEDGLFSRTMDGYLSPEARRLAMRRRRKLKGVLGEPVTEKIVLEALIRPLLSSSVTSSQQPNDPSLPKNPMMSRGILDPDFDQEDEEGELPDTDWDETEGSETESLTEEGDEDVEGEEEEEEEGMGKNPKYYRKGSYRRPSTTSTASSASAATRENRRWKVEKLARLLGQYPPMTAIPPPETLPEEPGEDSFSRGLGPMKPQRVSMAGSILLEKVARMKKAEGGTGPWRESLHSLSPGAPIGHPQGNTTEVQAETDEEEDDGDEEEEEEEDTVNEEEGEIDPYLQEREDDPSRYIRNGRFRRRRKAQVKRLGKLEHLFGVFPPPSLTVQAPPITPHDSGSAPAMDLSSTTTTAGITDNDEDPSLVAEQEARKHRESLLSLLLEEDEETVDSLLEFLQGSSTDEGEARTESGIEAGVGVQVTTGRSKSVRRRKMRKLQKFFGKSLEGDEMEQQRLMTEGWDANSWSWLRGRTPGCVEEDSMEGERKQRRAKKKGRRRLTVGSSKSKSSSAPTTDNPRGSRGSNAGTSSHPNSPPSSSSRRGSRLRWNPGSVGCGVDFSVDGDHEAVDPQLKMPFIRDNNDLDLKPRRKYSFQSIWGTSGDDPTVDENRTEPCPPSRS